MEVRLVFEKSQKILDYEVRILEVMEHNIACLAVCQVLDMSSTTRTIISYGSSDTLFYNFYNGVIITIKSPI